MCNQTGVSSLPLFRCGTGTSCLNISTVCDGYIDCDDGSDEAVSVCSRSAMRMTATLVAGAVVIFVLAVVFLCCMAGFLLDCSLAVQKFAVKVIRKRRGHAHSQCHIPQRNQRQQHHVQRPLISRPPALNHHFSESTGTRGTHDLLVTILPPSYSSVDVLSRLTPQQSREDVILRNPSALLRARTTPATHVIPCSDVPQPDTDTRGDLSISHLRTFNNTLHTTKWDYRSNVTENNVAFAETITSHGLQCEFEYEPEECYIDCATGQHVDFTDRADDINNSNMIDWRYFPNET